MVTSLAPSRKRVLPRNTSVDVGGNRFGGRALPPLYLGQSVYRGTHFGSAACAPSGCVGEFSDRFGCSGSLARRDFYARSGNNALRVLRCAPGMLTPMRSARRERLAGENPARGFNLPILRLAVPQFGLGVLARWPT